MYNILTCILLLLSGILTADGEEVMVGAERVDLYKPLLEGKRIALLSNHTGMVGDRHTLDVMLDNGLDVTTVFSPEHGFRGTASAGEHVKSSIDPKTGIPIASLYDGKSGKPSEETMGRFDVLVVDIQDVGTRFYTYYITMLDLMNAASAEGKQVVILDRPNPNGMVVDGPILDMKYTSGVGRLPLPASHGMTLGELGQMIVGEGWLKDGASLDLTVIPCLGYTHQTRYRLPMPPSPNLPDMNSVYLYPSLCYFEATDVSVGRGTDKPFSIYGHPLMKGPYSFTPKSRPGATKPLKEGQLCHGYDLSSLSDEEIIAEGINLEYVLTAYAQLEGKLGKDKKGRERKLLTSFFEKLIGNSDVRRRIEASGLSTSSSPEEIKRVAEEIEASWAGDIESFRRQRAPYLLYPE